MTMAFLKLESFDSDRVLEESAPITQHDAETLRARAFEEGYGAGWTDALDQMRNEDALRRVAAQEALQAVAFGYTEARTALESSFMDLAAQMISAVLPDLTSEALRRLLERELRVLVNQQFSGRLELVCAPGVKDSLSEILTELPGLDATLVEEESFSDAQVMIRVDQNARLVDFDSVTAALKAGLAALRSKGHFPWMTPLFLNPYPTARRVHDSWPSADRDHRFGRVRAPRGSRSDAAAPGLCAASGPKDRRPGGAVYRRQVDRARGVAGVGRRSGRFLGVRLTELANLDEML